MKLHPKFRVKKSGRQLPIWLRYQFRCFLPILGCLGLKPGSDPGFKPPTNADLRSQCWQFKHLDFCHPCERSKVLCYQHQPGLPHPLWALATKSVNLRPLLRCLSHYSSASQIIKWLYKVCVKCVLSKVMDGFLFFAVKYIPFKFTFNELFEVCFYYVVSIF